MTWMVPLLRGANDIDILGPTPVRNADQSAYLDALLKLPEFFVGRIVRNRHSAHSVALGGGLAAETPPVSTSWPLAFRVTYWGGIPPLPQPLKSGC